MVKDNLQCEAGWYSRSLGYVDVEVSTAQGAKSKKTKLTTRRHIKSDKCGKNVKREHDQDANAQGAKRNRTKDSERERRKTVDEIRQAWHDALAIPIAEALTSSDRIREEIEVALLMTLIEKLTSEYKETIASDATT